MDTLEAVTVAPRRGPAASILIAQARNAAAERPQEMEALIGPQGRGHFLWPRVRVTVSGPTTIREGWARPRALAPDGHSEAI